jgi:putative addiction module CopG family antidote
MLCAPATSEKVMNLNLPSDINNFVKGLVSQGRFDSEEAAVVEGIRMLMSREQLRGEIQKGVEQLDSGEWFDEETVFSELNAEIDKIESSQPGS